MAVALGVVGFEASTGHAHVGAGAGDTDILVHPGDPDARLLESPWGLVVSSDGEAFDWVCHEVLSAGAGEFPSFQVAVDGVMLGVTRQLVGNVAPGESLYRSADAGCSWVAAAGTSDRLVIGAAFHPTDPDVALAVTATPSTEELPTNGILRSVDGGQSFGEVLSTEGRTYRDVVFAGGSVAYALATEGTPLSAVLLRSDDGGESWVERTVPDDAPESPAFGVIADVDPSDPDEVWLSFDGNADDGVLRTLDGGESFALVPVPASLVLDLVLTPDGGAWLVGDQRQLWRSDDRETWTSVDAAPQVWGGAHVDGRTDFAVNTLAHDQALVSTTDGQSFDTVLTTLDLRGPLSCPADSDVALVCEPLWDDLYRALELMRPRPSGDDDDSAEPPSGCSGCAVPATAPSPWLAVLAPLWLWRRRH